jgi:hypothetical protein
MITVVSALAQLLAIVFAPRTVFALIVLVPVRPLLLYAVAV